MNLNKYIFLIFLFISLKSYVQQIPIYTQYFLNEIFYNPSFTGIKDHYQARTNYRFQWLGITDAPKTYILSVFGPHKVYNFGFGGYLINDVAGPLSKTGLYSLYSYHIQLIEDYFLSIGFSLGILQIKLDGSEVILHDFFDNSLGYNVYKAYIPDLSFGTLFFSNYFNIGFSIIQAFSSNINFSEVHQLGINKLKQHFFLHGSYLYQTNKDLSIEPTLIFAYVYPAPLQTTFFVKCIFNNKYWFGTGIRTKDALVFAAGIFLDNQISISYSYDYHLSNIKKFTTGSHEITVNMNFKKFKSKQNHKLFP